MNIRFTLLLSALIMLSLSMKAQSQYDKAESAFNAGHFTQVDSLLTPSAIKSMSQEDQIRSYRLLALSSLQLDHKEQAEQYVAHLLTIDPYYTAYNETPRFSDIVEQLKKGKATITTASRMAETVEEVPVPVTLITEDMIQASGARNLSDVLMCYVPGLSLIGSIDENVAMRGVYSMGQENMLVMIDGHRMNSQSTNGAPFDYRNDLAKIHQIEVLRGPASSLYGNAALTAVVNIITKSGSDIDGVQLSATLGNFNTFGGNFLIGHGNLRTEYTAWASVYNSQGERVTVNNTTHYIDGYNGRPTFDMGLKVRWGDVRVEVIGQHSKKVPYANLFSIGNQFSYDKYATKNEDKPGFSSTLTKVDFDYNHSWNNFTLSATAYASSEEVQIYNVLGDTVDQQTVYLLAKSLNLPSLRTRGLFEAVKWTDYSFGGTMSGSSSYEMSNGMKGSFIGGVQYECLTVGDACINIGADYINTNNVSDTVFYHSSEHTLSAFFQLKHNFTPRFIFNGGLRYDHKLRQDERRINTFSPRVSLIYLANSVLSLKGGYSYAFVDAPLFYRASKIALFSGGTKLNSESMDAIQLGANIDLEPQHLQFEANLFYNNVRDLIFYNLAATTTTTPLTATSESPQNNTSVSQRAATFRNSGVIKMGGIEAVAQYKDAKTFANLNLTYQYPFKIENFSSFKHKVANVPKFLLNLTAARTLIDKPSIGNVSIRGNMHLQSSIECVVNDALKMMTTKTVTYYHQPAYVTVSLGAEWKTPYRFTIALDTHNLFNASYRVGGQLADGIPGQSRSFIGRIIYNF